MQGMVQLWPGSSVATIDLASSFVVGLVTYEGRSRELPARSMMRKLFLEAATRKLSWKSDVVAREDGGMKMTSSGTIVVG